MNLALNEARLAFSNQEVPVGAVLVKENKIISQSFNQSISKNDPSGHAEMNVLRDASKKLNNYRLNGCSLYVTLEPCIMCAGAAFWSKIPKIVFGARDEKNGFLTVAPNIFHSKIQIEAGVLGDECRQILLDFFAKKR